jgi:hypothetical protein
MSESRRYSVLNSVKINLMVIKRHKLSEGWLKFSKIVKNTSTLKYYEIYVKLKQAIDISVEYWIIV